MTLADKLHPDRFTEMSGKMAAIIAFVLGEDWTDPAIRWMSVSSDGYEEREEFAQMFRERVDDHRPAPERPDYAELLH